jgi:hypothetical protein
MPGWTGRRSDTIPCGRGDYLDIPIPGEDDLDQVFPAGDMSIFADLGTDEMNLGALAGDLDQFPDEAIAKIGTNARGGRAKCLSGLDRSSARTNPG